MSDTPRTDAAVSPTALLHRSDGTYSEIVFAVFARQLERELAAAQAQRDKAVYDADRFFLLFGKYLERANEAEAQRDKALVILHYYRHEIPRRHQPYILGHEVDLLLKECGK